MAMHSRIEQMKKVAKTPRNHRELILNYFRAKKQLARAHTRAALHQPPQHQRRNHHRQRQHQKHQGGLQENPQIAEPKLEQLDQIDGPDTLLFHPATIPRRTLAVNTG